MDRRDLEIEVWRLDGETEALVRDWFAGRISDFRLDGARSVHMPKPGAPDRRIKIKGAGLKGGPIGWTGKRATGPRHPIFDFEGRMTEDVAFGHDNALPGGASFQQATTEWATAGALGAAGEDVVPCLGYGRVRRGDAQSWFSVFELGADWVAASLQSGWPVDRWRSLSEGHGATVARIARDVGLIGYFWYVAAPDGRLPIKDVHPFRRADPLSMSAVSWTMAVYFSIHIHCNHIEFAAVKRYKLPPEAVIWPFKELAPDATTDDFARLRAEIVAPYMVARPEPFDPRRLWDLLRGHPVTAALIELCPPEFARP